MTSPGFRRSAAHASAQDRAPDAADHVSAQAADAPPVARTELRRTPLWTRAVVDTERAARDVRVDGAFHAVMLQWTSVPFMTAFALVLGARPTFIGLVAALPFLARLSQLYASWRIERAGRWRRSAFLGAAVGRGAPLLLLPIALLPDTVLPAGVRQTLLLAVLLLTGLGAALFDVAWLTWMSELVPPRVRGAFFAGRNRVTSLAGLVAALVGAFGMDRWRAARGADGAAGPADDGRALAYGVLFAAAAVVGLLGLVWLRRVPDPRRLESRAEGPTLRDAMLTPWRDRAFRPMLAFGAAWGIGMGVAAPFFAVFMLTHLGLSLFEVMATTAGMTLVTALAQRHYGRLADRFGARTVLRAGTLLYVLTPLPWLVADPGSAWALWAPLVVLHVGAGLATAAVELTLNPFVLELAPDERRASYLASFGATYAAAQALSPLAGGALLDALQHGGVAPPTAFGALFLLAALTRLVAVPVLGRVHPRPGATRRPASVGRMLRVVGRARTMRLSARRARHGRVEGAVAAALPLEPVLSTAYAHLARAAELVARERAPRLGAPVPGMVPTTAGDARTTR